MTKEIPTTEALLRSYHKAVLDIYEQANYALKAGPSVEDGDSFKLNGLCMSMHKQVRELQTHTRFDYHVWLTGRVPGDDVEEGTTIADSRQGFYHGNIRDAGYELSKAAGHFARAHAVIKMSAFKNKKGRQLTIAIHYSNALYALSSAASELANAIVVSDSQAPDYGPGKFKKPKPTKPTDPNSPRARLKAIEGGGKAND